MSYLISDLKNEIEPKIHDTTLDRLSGSFYDKVYEAGRRIIARLDPIETIRTENITNAIYDKVYSYVAPSDLKGDSIITIRPQVNNFVRNRFTQLYREDFDLHKDNNTYTVRYNSGVKTVEISKFVDAGLLLNECDSLSSDGTWVAGGNANTLEVDTQTKVSGGGSLRFNLQAAGTSGYIEATSMASKDATDFYNLGAIFAFVYIPTTAALSSITSFTMRFGSSSSNYYTTSSVTSASDQTGFKVGWNLLRFDWNNLSTTGSPDYTDITYVRFTVAYSSTPAINGIRVDSMSFKLGSIYEIEYYSDYLFRNTNGTWIEKPTADTDIINLAPESYNLMLYELAEIISQELQGSDSSIDVEFFGRKRNEEWVNYMRNNKSQKAKKSGTYYRVRRRR